MAVAAKPEISKILLDLGIEPVDVYAVDNAEKTYISALVEGINTLEVANKGESTRSRILREELKAVKEKKRKKINVGKLIGKRTLLAASKIKPQALLPGSADSTDKKTGGFAALTKVVQGIINILKLGNKQDKKEFEVENKENQRDRREKREKALEAGSGALKAAAGAGKKIVSTLISPFKKIWDSITKFLKFLVAGFLFNKVFNWFLDPENMRKIDSLGRFLKDYWPSLATFGLLFLTPLGGIIKGLLSFVAWAVPMLVKLIARNPLLAGGIILGGITIDQLMKKMEREQNAITEEFQQRRDAGETRAGRPITREQVEDEYYKRNGTILSNLSGGFVNNMVNPLSRIFKTGGEVVGPPHSRGGVDIEVEGGEYVVNKKRAGLLGPILDWLNFGNLNQPPVKTTPMGFPSLTDKRLVNLIENFMKSANVPSSSPSPSPSPSRAPSMNVASISKRPLRVATPPPPSSNGVTVFEDSEILPPITQAETRQGNDGKTLPSFNITSSSSHRTLTLIALELE